jgi:mono/diheme cytochrome c family protein
MKARISLRSAVPLALALLAFAAAASGQQAVTTDASAIARGKEQYDRMCAPCHGADKGDFGRAMLPGTDALRIKYQGKLPALLTERADLTPAIIKAFVRTGTWSMPPFRKTEISDAQIEEISAYIASTAQAAR